MAKPPVVLELEKVFDVLNQAFFDGKLPTPSFLIQIEKKVIFRFVPESYNLVIGSKFAESSLEQILVDMLHKMVHIYNKNRNMCDCTSNQYHNKKFLEVALRVGLFVTRHKTRGWGVTHLSKENNKSTRKPFPRDVEYRSKVLKKLSINTEVIEQAQSEIAAIVQAKGKSKVCFLKYECGCPPPHNSIRSGRRPDGLHPLNATCMICGKPFVCSKDQ
jgi:hypothetical protein